LIGKLHFFIAHQFSERIVPCLLGQIGPVSLRPDDLNGPDRATRKENADVS